MGNEGMVQFIKKQFTSSSTDDPEAKAERRTVEADPAQSDRRTGGYRQGGIVAGFGRIGLRSRHEPDRGRRHGLVSRLHLRRRRSQSSFFFAQSLSCQIIQVFIRNHWQIPLSIQLVMKDTQYGNQRRGNQDTQYAKSRN